MEEVYVILNSVDDSGWRKITAICSDLPAAKEEIKHHCDYYRAMGTGEIYKVKVNQRLSYDENSLVYKN